MKFLVSVVVCALISPFIVAVALVILAWRAWWLHQAWGWFIVPLGVRPVSLWHFAALIFFVSTLTYKIDTEKDDRGQDPSKLALSLMWPPMAWGVLWCIQKWWV